VEDRSEGEIMKIVKEIIRALTDDGCLITVSAESIIAAKLEPVRDALAGLIGTAQRIAFEDAGLHNSDWQVDPHDALQLTLPEAVKALALFEKEKP